MITKDDVRPTWDDIFMEICEIISMRSVCKYVKAGSVIIDPETNSIIAIWYNWPSAWDVHCSKVWCARIVNGELVKHWDRCRWAHGEINAIINASRSTKWMVMYCLSSPCKSCAKHIVNAKIKRLVFKHSYWGTDYIKETIDYLQRLWVEVTRYEWDKRLF